MSNTQKTFFDKKFDLIRDEVELYILDGTQPEHADICNLFNLFDDVMSWFYQHENDSQFDIDEWRENLDLCGIRAYRIYKNLKSKGIEVEYNPNLLKNRFEDCKCTPDRLEFHLHHHAVEDLLNFCILRTGYAIKS